LFPNQELFLRKSKTRSLPRVKDRLPYLIPSWLIFITPNCHFILASAISGKYHARRTVTFPGHLRAKTPKKRANNFVKARYWEDSGQIQDYLGHVNVETTMIYTHVVRDFRRPAKSPMDLLKNSE
jgi:integrase